MTKKYAKTPLTKPQLVDLVKTLRREKARAEKMGFDADEAYQAAVNGRAEALRTVNKLKEELHSAYGDFESVAAVHGKRVLELEAANELQRSEIEEIHMTMRAQQNVLRETTDAHSQQQEELCSLRSTLFHPALMVCLHRCLEDLEDERFAGKKEKIELLIKHLGEHMTTASLRDPSIWKLLAEDLY